MSCEQICELLDAYVDQELDVIASSQFDRHLLECPACRAKRDQFLRMRGSVKAYMEHYRAPEDFERKLRAQLFPVDAHKDPNVRPRRFFQWTQWAVITACLAVVLLSVALFEVARRPSAQDMLAQEVVSSHVRSLLANHLSDVASTDQHTVKPWFNGKLDFAPVVKDLAVQGYPLVGGRLDYLDDRTVAALVYKRRQHTINLFIWPSSASDSRPRVVSKRGYNMVHWVESHMAYWAVSDVNASDLEEFARDVISH